MKTKQDAIKEAYGEYFGDVKNLTDENGFIWQSTLFFPETELQGKFEIEVKGFPPDGRCKWRPKSLQGIENNNGWIKIESESDLPKKNDMYLVTFENMVVSFGEFEDTLQNIQFWIKNYTHYQPIQKPKPPIF